MMSVPRLMPSMSEWRQPYLLSNFDLVTESFTLIAGKRSLSSLANSYRRWTPVVVSSVTPWNPAATLVQCCGSASRLRRSVSSTTWYSAGSSAVTLGTTPAFSNSTPLWTSIVASPPSSRIMFGPRESASTHVIICSAHHQYSSSDSPFQAKQGMPWGASTVPCGPTTTAAAAASWGGQMLQE